MRRFTFPSLLFGILAVISTAGLSDVACAEDPTTPESLIPEPTAEGKFVVHEWGTFTTFSGSDGVYMDFRPLAVEHSDLPYYVLDRGSYSKIRWVGKSRLRGRVRMETPVTYFYTDRVRTVDVRVDFPQGLLTEFYPPVREMLPPVDETKVFGEGEAIGDSSLAWGKVDLIPIGQLIPTVQDPELRKQLTNNLIQSLLPIAANDQHYAAARQTDAALVHVRGKAGLHHQVESFFEKFLFYRGVGKFQLPISAKFESDRITVSNDGALPINAAIVIHVDGDRIMTTKIDGIEAHESQTRPFRQLTEVSVQQLADAVKQSLVDEGLYGKEAASMVKTWQQSWFTENGTRVLYMVPGPTTDELLPLHVTPRPKETLRVLVGRMEMMSPEDEQRMIQAVMASSKTRLEHFAKPVPEGKKRKPYHIPASVREYGRMAEPALVRIRMISEDPIVREEAKRLIAQYRM